MTRKSDFALALLFALSKAQETKPENDYAFGTIHECLVVDADHIVMYREHYLYGGGGWIDDGEILYKKWDTGMGIRALNYCIDETNNTYRSMQLMVGNEGDELANWISLRKHGADGGHCRRWRIDYGDYIRNVQYTWNVNTESIVQVVFQTHLGKTRVFGRGEGKKVNFEYTAFQPFVGIISWEYEEKTLGIGAYEDDCHMTPTKLPFGFGDFNLPSMNEVQGNHSSASMTWVNEEHGTSSKEVTMLDQIEAQEKVEDGDVAEIENAAHVVNNDFEAKVDVKAIIIVDSINKEKPAQPATNEPFYFPPNTVLVDTSQAAAETEGSVIQASPAIEDSDQFKQMVSEQTQKLITQIASLRTQLSKTNNDLSLTDQYLRNSSAGSMITEEKEADTTQSDTLVLAMAVFLLIMLGIVFCLLCVIRNQKRRRTDDAIKQNRQPAQIDMSESDSEIASPKKIAGNVLRDVNRANQLQDTPSRDGLIDSQSGPMSVTHTHILSAQTQTPNLTDAERAIAKQTNADTIANPADVNLDFRPNQPEIAFDPESQNDATGQNPFAGGAQRSEDDDDDGNLNLTEESVDGPSAGASKQQINMHNTKK